MGEKLISKNKRASFDYILKEKVEAGLVLVGTEVKSLRSGKCSFQDAYCAIDKKQEVWLYQFHIPEYAFGNRQNHDETRKRKLLLKKEQIKKIEHSLATKGLTLIPTRIYFKNGLVKIEIALGQGKKLYDKRASEREKEVKKKLQRGVFE